MILKKIFKKNQIIITALALMIAVAGYINYSDNIKEKQKVSAADSPVTETTPADTDVLESETDPETGEVLSRDVETDEAGLTDPGATVLTSNLNSEFIISAKLEREQVRATSKESLLGIINNAELTEAEKTAAVTQMAAITDASEKELAAELLLEAKGFNNVIVSITNEQVDVVIEIDELTDTDRAQIEDIVTRKTESTVDMLRITTVTPVK